MVAGSTVGIMTPGIPRPLIVAKVVFQYGPIDAQAVAWSKVHTSHPTEQA